MTLVTTTRAGRGTRVRVLYEVPRGYMAISSHSGSCDHGCGDQCCRQQFQLSHSSSPFVKSQYHLAPRVAGLASGDCRATESTRWLAIPHQLETRQAIDLFRRTSLAGT